MKLGMKFKTNVLLTISLFFGLFFSLVTIVDAQTTITKDISYGNHQLQKLDLYVPNTHGLEKLPVIVYIHGGGWKSGDKSSKSFLFREYANTNLFAVASINYRLVPEVTVNSQYGDCIMAVQWLQNNATTYELDPNNIGILGSSAGGHLGLMVALKNNNPLGIKCIVSAYGATDLWNMPQQNLISQVVGQPYNETTANEESPLYNIGLNAPPLQIIHGENDPVVPIQQSIDLINAYPNSVNFIVMLNQGHGKFHLTKSRRRNLAFFTQQLYKNATINTAPFIP